MATNTPRPPVVPRLMLQQAAIALEATLQRNDEKGDWADEALRHVVSKLTEEMGELLDEVPYNSDIDREAVRHEALDVAACALMVWARAGGSNTTNRGREVAHG